MGKISDVKTATLKEDDIILVKPAASAVIMTGSTIVVAINAGFLKVKK